MRREVQPMSVAGVYQVHYVLTPDGWRIQNRVEQLIQYPAESLYDIPTPLYGTKLTPWIGEILPNNA
jgi:hypothetical protein